MTRKASPKSRINFGSKHRNKNKESRAESTFDVKKVDFLTNNIRSYYDDNNHDDAYEYEYDKLRYYALMNEPKTLSADYIHSYNLMLDCLLSSIGLKNIIENEDDES